MLCESISLLNYIIRDRPNWLNYYRLLNVFFLRMPIWILYLYYHNGHFNDYMIITRHLGNYGTVMFIIYDIVIIRKTLALMKRVPVKQN
jgi:hypothetical protein